MLHCDARRGADAGARVADNSAGAELAGPTERPRGRRRPYRRLPRRATCRSPRAGCRDVGSSCPLRNAPRIRRARGWPVRERRGPLLVATGRSRRRPPACAWWRWTCESAARAQRARQRASGSSWPTLRRGGTDARRHRSGRRGRVQTQPRRGGSGTPGTVELPATPQAAARLRRRSSRPRATRSRARVGHDIPSPIVMHSWRCRRSWRFGTHSTPPQRPGPRTRPT